jgi:serine protease Do
VVLAQVSPDDLRLLRRTPVVEVFDASKDAIVFVTGPIFQGDRPKLEEFFKVPGAKPFEHSVGTGFVVHPSGYVVANAHGVERVISHQMVLSDGKKYPAELVASSGAEDLALLKIEAGRPLPCVQLARAGDVMIGETIIVIGHPHGLLHTCTTGIVSAVGRTTNLADRENLKLTNLIQTDAGINPGSSGGPWFNVVGEVMGMTVSKKGGADNISFAIPVATIRRLLPGMLDVEGRLGLVTGLTVGGTGACRVTAVKPESSAANAGVQVDDVITSVADVPTPTLVDYHFALLDQKPEETVEVDLLRNDQPVHASVVMGRRPGIDVGALLSRKLGLSAQPLDERRAKAMLLQVGRGVVVTAVDPSIYRNVDHRPAVGDVLARINRIRPRDMDHLGILLDDLETGDQVTMVFVRYASKTATRVDIKLTLP